MNLINFIVILLSTHLCCKKKMKRKRHKHEIRREEWMRIKLDKILRKYFSLEKIN